MAVDNTNIVDFVSINPSGEVVLTISDHMEWDAENKHILMLQEKLNRYLTFIESGELLEQYPDANGRKAVVSVVALYKPNETAKSFLENVRGVVEGAGIGFQFSQKHFNSPA